VVVPTLKFLRPTCAFPFLLESVCCQHGIFLCVSPAKRLPTASSPSPYVPLPGFLYLRRVFRNGQNRPSLLSEDSTGDTPPSPTSCLSPTQICGDFFRRMRTLSLYDLPSPNSSSCGLLLVFDLIYQSFWDPPIVDLPCSTLFRRKTFLSPSLAFSDRGWTAFPRVPARFLVTPFSPLELISPKEDTPLRCNRLV